MIQIIKNIFQHLFETTQHKIYVLYYLSDISLKLILRGLTHDMSKYYFAQSKYFIKTVHKLRATEYGTEEYKKLLEEIRPAIEHHYKLNSHHPEHHENGVDDMSFIDEIEMVCDWIAASKRHSTGNPFKSIDINSERFGFSKDRVDLYKKILLELDIKKNDKNM